MYAKTSLLISSLALSATTIVPAAADANNDVRFSYDRNASAAEIMDTLSETARKACKEMYRNSAQPGVWGQVEAFCAKKLLDSVVAESRNSELAQYYWGDDHSYKLNIAQADTTQ